MKLIRKLVTGLMILLVVLGSSPLEVFALPNNNLTEWPTGGTNDVTSTLPKPPALENIVDLKQMFNYPKLDYSGLDSDRPGELDVIKSLEGYVPVNDSSVAVITRDAPWQAGVMWSTESNKINLAEPFHMISYVYLGSRGQAEKIVDGNKRAGADGITFTIHNDKKNVTLSATERTSRAGSVSNYGINAYGALGNGLGVYGSNFSANTASDNNNMAYMTKGVTNGIVLEFDTFYNHNNTTQHSDNDLWQFMKKSGSYGPGNNGEGSPESNYGHIGINYLNKLQNNVANNEKQFGYGSNQVIKHNTMLAVGWDGGISGLNPQNGWQVSTPPQTKLADNKWHRLEVEWKPKTLTTGELTYRIYQQGHTGERNISDIYDTSKDGTAVLKKTVTVDVKTVFDVDNINNKVYWGFTGSTGYYQNNQAVQMLQLPDPYYKSGIRKVDQDGNLVKNAKFQLQVRNGDNWQPVVFQKAVGSETQDYVLTGVDNGLIGVTTDLDETSLTYGKVTATQLLKGTYRWVEIEAPEGYKIKQRYYPDENDGFELKYILGSDNESSIDFDVTNTKLSQIELYKKDEHTNQPLNGVKFTISKIVNGTQSYLTAKSDNSDFEWTKTESEAKQFETGKSYFVRNGIIVESVLAETDKGYIRIGYIENGANLSWKEVEVSVPKGYDSSGELTGNFKPSTKDNGYVYSATQTNSRLYQVSLEKKASDTNKALPGAVFSLEQFDGSKWNKVGDEKTTDEAGKITISNLKAGTYRWKEVKAPAGYQRSQEYFPDEKGFVVKYDSNLNIDPDTNNYTFNTTTALNEYTPKGSFTFRGNKKLLGRDIKDYRFTFTVIRDGEIIQKVNNDEQGNILFEDILLTKGDIGKTKYQIVEYDDKQQGIVYDQKVYEIEVSVTDDGKGNIIATYTDPEITFTNAHREMPETGFNYNFYIPVLILIVVTLILFNDKRRIFKEIW